GSHDGYAGLADPVMHRRGIELDKRARRIVIRDELEMRGSHDVEIFFHGHEACRVHQRGNIVSLARNGKTVILRLPDGGESAILLGSTAPIGGWVSRAFDRKDAAPTIVWRARLAGFAELTTVIAA